MSKKEIDKKSSSVHGVVIFKAKKVNQSTTVKKPPVEKVDQEEKIIVFINMKPFSGNYIYSIQLYNQSLAPISDLKIEVTFPDFLILTRSFPPTISTTDSISKEDLKQISINFDKLDERSKKQIELHFTPISLDNSGEIQTFFTFINAKDLVKTLNSDSVKIIIDKIKIEPKIIPSSFIREFSQMPEIKKAIKSLGIGVKKKINTDMFFDILEQIFFIHNLQLISKDDDQKIIWFFGNELESNEDILVIGQIVSKKVEIIVLSQNHDVLISYLTMVLNDFKDRILLDGIIKSKKDVYELECKHCGNILPDFPKRGKSIECKSCSYEQIIW